MSDILHLCVVRDEIVGNHEVKCVPRLIELVLFPRSHSWDIFILILDRRKDFTRISIYCMAKQSEPHFYMACTLKAPLLDSLFMYNFFNFID